ncbi:Glu/Leu/Phe/Val dehydrogenase dimerization domain-containing protein, partial [Staphylococcus hominis]|uniref:Glu/Leu/Phe/Val dehydrogenase dimerization domain-containing protein n=1 Tax=Staphylococcus hominis TaxID=1290 RepID=UPI003D07BD47
MTENNNLVTSTQSIIKEALHKLGFDDGMYDLIKEPLRFLQVRIPVRMDDGTVKTFTGYRAQHNDAVYSGDIAAAVGLKETGTGDTLCGEKND